MRRVTPETPRRIRRGLLAAPRELLTTPEATRCGQPLGSLAMDLSQQAPGGAPASPLPASIDELWAARADLSPDDEQARAIVVGAVDLIDAGQARVAWADTGTGSVVVDERAKRAILLAFRLLPMVGSQVGDFRYHDRVPLTAHLEGVRAVPGAIVRWGAYVAPGAVLMPSFVNIGAYVDTGATVGSCAQIGKNVHLAGGVGIGGVLEPPGAVPVLVGDDAVIYSRCMVVEGACVGRGAVLGA